MEQISERIASISFPTILLVLLWLTIARGALYASRVKFFRLLGDGLEPLILAVALVFLVLRPFVVQSFYIPSSSMRPTLTEGNHILVNKWIYRMRPPQYGEVIVFRAPPDVAIDEKEFIKRVIGVPGDHIEVMPGSVMVGNTFFDGNEVRATLGEPLSVTEFSANAALAPPLRLTTDAIWLGEKRISPGDFALAAHQPGKTVVIQPGRVVRNGETLMETFVAEDTHYSMTERVVPAGCYFVMGDNRNHSNDSHEWGTLPADRLIGRAEIIYWPLSHAKRIH